MAIHIEWLYFLILGVILVFATFYDVKYKKIPNFIIIYGLISAIIFNLIIFSYSFFYYLIPRNELFSFFKEFLVSWLQMIFIMFFLWLIGFMSAGDAKLLIVIYALMPPNIFHFNHLKNAYHITHLQNLFLIVLLIFFKDIKKVHYKKKEVIKKRIRSFLSWRFIVQVSFFVYAISLVSKLLYYFLGIPSNNFFLNIIWIFIFWKLFQVLFKKWFNLVIFSLCLVRLYIDRSMLLYWQYWFNTLVLIIVLLIIRFIYVYYAYEAFTKEVKIENLKPGMILAEKVRLKRTKNRYEFIKGELFMPTFLMKMDDSLDREYKEFQRLISYDPRVGLSKSSVEKLKSLKKHNLMKYETIRVFHEYSLTPYIFIATILTIIFRGDLITSLLVFLFK